MGKGFVLESGKLLTYFSYSFTFYTLIHNMIYCSGHVNG